MTDFVAYSSRWRLALLAAAAVFAVCLGLWMIGIFGPPPPPRGGRSASEALAIGWFTVVFFGLCSVQIVRSLFKSSEELRIGSAGIRWTRWSDRTIPWSEVVDVTTWRFKGQRSIVLHLRDRSGFPGKGLLGGLAGANRMLTGGDVAISLTGTDRSFDEAMSALLQFRDQIGSGGKQ